MADTSIQVTQGAGTRLHTFDRTIGGQTVHDEVMVLGEPYLASYVVATSAISCATLTDHMLQLMAGASLNVRIRRIRVEQRDLASAASQVVLHVLRVTSAGTGGSTVTVVRDDNSDPAPGATARTLPTSKGTEAADPWLRIYCGLTNVQPVTGVFAYEWTSLANDKPLIIPAGTSNGIVIKVSSAVAGATMAMRIEFDESSF